MVCIKVNNLSYQYPTASKKTLHNVSFEIEQGTLCSIVGLNGMGKSTLCGALRGFVPQFYKGRIKGSAEVAGIDVCNEELGHISRKIGYVFQNPFMQISGTTESVYEEIAFGLQNLGWERSAIISRVDEVLEMLNVTHLKDRAPTALSGGQMQRVAFASVLAMDPEVFIIDEPTAQLDPKGTQEIFEIIALLKSQKKTIVLVEHKMDLIAHFSDQILLIHEGQIMDNGTPHSVLTNKNNIQWGLQLPDYVDFSFKMEKKDSNYSCNTLDKLELKKYIKQNYIK